MGYASELITNVGAQCLFGGLGSCLPHLTGCVDVWGFQPAQEERREEQEPDSKDLEGKEGGEGKEESAEAELKPEAAEPKADKDPKAAQRSIRRHRNMYCKVVLLDDTIFECSMDVSTHSLFLLFSLTSPPLENYHQHYLMGI